MATPGSSALRALALVPWAAAFGGVVLLLGLGAGRLGIDVPLGPVTAIGAVLGVVASPRVRRAVEGLSTGRWGVVPLAISCVLVGAMLALLGLGVLVPAICSSAASHSVLVVPSRQRLLQSLVLVVTTSALCWWAQAAGWVDGVVPVEAAALLGAALLAITAPMTSNTAHLAARARRAAAELEQERRQHVEVLQHAADHDALTGLVGRRGLSAPLERAAAAAAPTAQTAVLFVDLDGFKAVNDAHGHAAGDELLGVLGARLLHCVRPHDVVARTGGDEFVLLLTDLPDPLEAQRVAERVRTAVAAEVELSDGTRVRVGASTGTAVTAAPRLADDLLREADARMYAEKVARRASAGG